jgi:hypothetical protein
VPGEHKDVRTARPDGGSYREGTRLNVSDSDGTAILYNQSIKGGTSHAQFVCAIEATLRLDQCPGDTGSDRSCGKDREIR